jgi:hypothetical protein
MGVKEELMAEVAEILRRSDIVWPKYGSENVKQLAERIVNRVDSLIKASLQE